MSEVSFTQVVQRGCGIDIHRDEAVATIGGEGLKAETRSYKTFSSSLTELKEWLIENGVDSMDCQRSSHQVCTRSQDRQEGQCLDMQVASCRSVEAELHTTSGTTSIARPYSLSDQTSSADCFRKEPHHPYS